MKVVWSNKSRYTFYNNRNYLKQYWNDTIAENFEKEVLHTIELLQKNPLLGKYDAALKCRLILVSKQVSLFYEINHDIIVLLTFWDNRQKPISFFNL